MSLSYNDLLEEEVRLREIIEHADAELKAIQVLLKGRELRREGDQGQLFHDIKDLSVEKSVLAIHEEFTDKWFTGSEMTEEIKKRDPSKNTKHLRAAVGNSQRRLLKLGKLIRENKGSEKMPNMDYTIKNVVINMS